jgi:hypothetical protein
MTWFKGKPEARNPENNRPASNRKTVQAITISANDFTESFRADTNCSTGATRFVIS